MIYKNDSKHAPKRLLRFGGLIAVLAIATLACGTLDFAGDILRRLPTPTPTLSPPPEPVFSDTWYVSTDGDDGHDCQSPAEACRTINGAVGKAAPGDTVQIAGGTYTGDAASRTETVTIEKPVVLVGAGPDATIIDGGGSTTVIGIRVDGQVGLHDLTITNGGPVAGSVVGCGVRNMMDESEVVMNNVWVRDNECQEISYGGAGILNFGDIILIDVRVENNTLSVPEVHSRQGMGAGIFNLGTLDMNGGVIRGNRNEDWRGGGLANGFSRETSATLTDVWIDSNEAMDFGGGVVNDNATLVIQHSTISNNSPDGISNLIDDAQPLQLVNTTVSGNDGPGVRSWGSLATNFSTITDNHVGVLYLPSIYETIFLFENSIIAGNRDYSINSQGAGLLGFDYLALTNLWGPVDPHYGGGFGRASSRDDLYEATDPGLGPLADNGGSTLTHALLPLSPAVDRVDSGCLPEDQRSEVRPKPEGGACDIGAFELDLTAMSSPTSAEGTPLAIATVSPTPAEEQDRPTVITDTLCWKGPGSQYETVSSLLTGTEVEILGRGIEGGWWVLDNPRYPGVACWTPEDDLQVDPLYPVPEKLFEIPPLPTPTATPILGCLWYDQNQAEVCYPIGQCPVDFDDSLGACTP
jgi:hypothetical protein